LVDKISDNGCVLQLVLTALVEENNAKRNQIDVKQYVQMLIYRLFSSKNNKLLPILIAQEFEDNLYCAVFYVQTRNVFPIDLQKHDLGSGTIV